MAMALISKDEMHPFEIGYVSKYHMGVKTPETSLAKSYEEENRMEIELEIPKAVYQEEAVQTLLDWIKMGYSDNGYYRELALHITETNGYERTIAFTHAEVNGSITFPSQEDYVKVEMVINQKADKQVGVAFGEELEETLAKAWDRVNNPPRLNIFVPVGEEEELRAPGKYSIKFNVNEKLVREYDGDIENGVVKFEVRGKKFSAPPEGAMIAEFDDLYECDDFFLGFYQSEISSSKREVVYQKKQIFISLEHKVVTPSVVSDSGYLKKAGKEFNDTEWNAASGFIFNGATYVSRKHIAAFLIKLGYTTIHEGTDKIKVYMKGLTQEKPIPLDNKFLNINRIVEDSKAKEENILKERNIKKDGSTYLAPADGYPGKITLIVPIYDIRKVLLSNNMDNRGRISDFNNYIYNNKNHIKYFSNTLSQNFKDGCAKAYGVGGLYNNDYKFEFKVRQLDHNEIKKLRRNTIQEEKHQTIANIVSIFSFILSKWIGTFASESNAALFSMASDMNDLLGLEGKAIEKFDPKSISYEDFSTQHRGKSTDKIVFVEGGTIANSGAYFASDWILRVVYVKNQSTGEYVPCVCTYMSKMDIHLSLLVYDRSLDDVNRKSTTVDLSINNFCKNSNNCRISLDSEGDINLTNDLIPTPWEKEQAKIIFSQCKGRFVLWDHENSSAKKVVILADPSTKAEKLYFENFEDALFSNISCPYELENK